MSKRDYYEVMGLAKGASADELKKSYRRLAMKYHPDRNPGDAAAEASFKETKEAYEVLSDERKRAIYDQYGHAGLDPTAGAGRAAGFGGADGLGDIFGDVFGDIFGGGRRSRSGVYRGADLRYEMALDLEQAVFGASVNVSIPALRTCEPCKGSGAAPGSGTTSCRRCGGSGNLRVSQGFFSIQQTCSSCGGSGQTIEKPCSSCQGRGRVQETRTLSVKVPAGVDDGDRIRLSGEGEAGQNGGPPGDLYVEIRVRPHDIFERNGADLSCVVPVSFATAALGGSIEIPTLDGEVTLKIPAETQPGKVFRLRGKGVTPVRSSSVGDLYCRIDVEVPVHLTPEQKRLLKAFNDSLSVDGGDHRPRSDSWRDGVRRFFSAMNS
ncbi:MAG: molecular chaperone DnaJ [Gammaproteobacteria bacterium]|nr:molecular chaperone DnaJ [Gammaproteobacteria bacterium]